MTDFGTGAKISCVERILFLKTVHERSIDLIAFQRQFNGVPDNRIKPHDTRLFQLRADAMPISDIASGCIISSACSS
jgi:hypothetical protein